jgi:hypothetical protein
MVYLSRIEGIENIEDLYTPPHFDLNLSELVDGPYSHYGQYGRYLDLS